MKIAIAFLLFMSTIAAAHAFGLGKEGKSFGRMGSISNKKGASGPAATGKILLVDGTSFLLKLDGTSKLCRVGGC